LARRDNNQRRILLKAKIASIVVKLDISQLIAQTRKKTNMARRKTRKVCLRGRNITRRRRMAKPTLLSGIPMQAPMKMMMTSLQRVLLELLSRKLFTLLQAILSHGKR
jgi:hypothetical protein